ERLVPGGLPTEATVAQVLVARYADHLPLYRQAQMLARQGLTLGREVLADWLGTAAQEIRPVLRRLREILLASPRLFADETTLPVLDPGRGKVKKGYAWALARDDRPWGGRDPPAVVFRYAPGRGQEYAKALLADYRGIVQCDGYAAYKAVAGDRTLAFCWAHVRRGFVDLAKGGAAPIAAEVLQRIAALYAIEAEIRGRPAEERLTVRQARSWPLVTELFTWLDAQLGRLPRSSPTAEAIRYALNHRQGLEQFLDDGRIEVDNNTVERAIRPICLSRKNALSERLVPGGLPTEATVAQVLVARYADHLPLYRQAQMLARQGLTLGREVLADWLGTAAQEIRPVVRRLREILLASPRLFADETTLPVLDPGRGKVKKGYAWALVRNDRAWGGRDPPAVVFRYAPGRGQEHARALLAGYRGIVQCDGYAAYKALVTGGDMTLAFCWAHVRRGFFDLAKGGAAPIAAEVLQRIAALYAIEAEIRGRPVEERLAVRQARSRPLVAELFTWLDAQLARLPRSSPTAEAIRYALNHRQGLERFLDDGRIEVDNNTVERAIRPICLSRKNAL
ncbi:IS66 family transposase, partial [Teichococcus vastitatis]